MGDVAGNSERVRTERSLAWGIVSLVCVTLFLIVLGAMVRAHGAGLACPDWPLCFGELIPRFDFRVAYEWSHRVLASLVSLGLLALTLLMRFAAPRAWAERWRGFALAWSLLGVQVVLGGLTVLLKLMPWTVTAHLLIGISFCSSLLWLARDVFESPQPPSRTPTPARVAWLGGLCAGLLALQLLLGGLVSSQFAGLACTSFPTCDGSSFAPTFSGLVGLHVLHRLNALALLGGLLALSWCARGEPRVYRFAFLALRLALVQIGVGVLNVLVELSVEVTALHTLFAAGIALLMCLTVREMVLGRARSLPVSHATRGGSTTAGRSADLEATQIA